ncbi:protein phosphatase 1 regulatory subunit 12A-like isoform X3 [Stegodyphus dumicola]|uniref:protein phosphatase 1 regulatory subunit 12A-like isoform X3 n=1 Tax=Stegodyphus dumicola TaxID=202533 RepID=UPI0015AC9F8D|nr:protein phosphatase 1 regulatory subunit 12A-like isoform X3 [Stegodyphus dumicola]
MVQFLVEHGCDVNRGDNEGWTPLHATASCGFLSIARYLIEHGANVAAVNNDGDLPIDIAESSEMEEYLSNVLDEQGIDCDEARSEEEHIMLEDAKQMLNSNKYQDRIHPRTGATALHVAAAKGYIKVMNILIQVGADLNAQDNDGWTPLHAAAHWGQKEACAVLADNLANMDIQNFAGQTCFDVAEPELVKLLEELKKKQASMQKDRPEIQAILQRTSNRPPLKRRTSVTRMSGQEKSKSVMKDTKSERAHIENLTLPEEEGEEEKEKRQIEALERVSALKKDVSDKEEKDILPKKVPTYESKPAAVEPSVKEQQPEKIPSWKKVLRRSSENLEDSNIGSEISEVTLKRPKRSNEDSSEKSNGPLETNKDGLKKNSDLTSLHSSSPCTEAISETSSIPTTPSSPSDTSSESQSQDKWKPFIPPVRDDESELQRKAHAKRVRETRRSTQGVLLEDIKSAELQYLINTQREAAKRQAEETDMIKQAEEVEALKRQTEEAGTELTEVEGNKKEKQKSASDDSSEFDVLSTKVDRPSRIGGKSEEGGKTPDSSDGPSVTLVLRSKSASSPDDTSPSESRTSLGIQAAIQRRRRPKRRSTGVVYLDSDDAQEEKENTNDKDCNSQTETGPAERSRHRYGSSTSIPDTASEASSRSDTPSRYSSISSKSSLNEEENKDYKKLYEEVKKENERLKEQLRKTEEELEGTKKQLQKLSQSNSAKNSLSDAEKKERRSLERKLSEMEEEIKNISKLKAENEKLKAENRALSRVVCKLSK